MSGYERYGAASPALHHQEPTMHTLPRTVPDPAPPGTQACAMGSRFEVRSAKDVPPLFPEITRRLGDGAQQRLAEQARADSVSAGHTASGRRTIHQQVIPS